MGVVDYTSSHPQGSGKGKRKKRKGERMSDHHVYKKVEIVGSSRDSIEDAINNAIAECSKQIRNVEWFEVQETRGHVENGQVGHYQVVLKVGFRIEGS
jgi:flavin-binding protein dodecin